VISDERQQLLREAYIDARDKLARLNGDWQRLASTSTRADVLGAFERATAIMVDAHKCVMAMNRVCEILHEAK